MVMWTFRNPAILWQTGIKAAVLGRPAAGREGKERGQVCEPRHKERKN
jgi:hypothetical protein